MERVFVLQSRRILALLGGALVVADVASCIPRVNCEALCKRTLSCQVTFGNRDDPDGLKVASGERSPQAACSLGCQESAAVTVASAGCVDEVTITQDPLQCQDDVLRCLQSAAPSDGEGE